MTDNKPTIVVVDDSSTSVSLYQFSLQSLEIDFVSFNSPSAAWPYLQENAPDLLFLDIIMPGMDGLTFLEQIRGLSHQKSTPVIMVTSKDYAQDRYIAKKFGALDFLIKPLNGEKIRTLIYKYARVKPPMSS